MQQDQPLANFETMKVLFQFLKVKHTPKKHKSDNVGWEFIVNVTKKTFHSVPKYIVINCDKVTIINNQSWVNAHAYLLDGFKCISILLNLERLIGGGTWLMWSSIPYWFMVA